MLASSVERTAAFAHQSYCAPSPGQVRYPQKLAGLLQLAGCPLLAEELAIGRPKCILKGLRRLLPKSGEESKMTISVYLTNLAM
jgi:hypothetical protein